MPQAPNGVVFTVESKNEGQQKWQIEDQFAPDDAAGYPEGDAAGDALAAFHALYEAHTGGTREYRIMKCIELGYEVRPV